MKLVIVDDEVLIVDMIKAIIDWSRLGLTCVGVAHNGMEACRIIEEQKPDIVITDIRLPGVDGLGVIKICSERGDSCKFIVISGYKQFEYAQTAMSYGVKEYLLKPIKENDINGALEKIIQEIKLEHAAQDSLSEAESRLDDNRIILREGFMKELLANQLLGKGIDSLNKTYMLSFCPGTYQLMIFKIDADCCSERENEDIFLKSLKEKFYTEIIEKSKKYCHELVYQEQGKKIYVILNFDEKQERELLFLHKESMNILTKYTSMFKNVKVTLAKGAYFGKLDDAVIALEETEQILWQRIVPGMSNILSVKVMPEHIQDYTVSKSVWRSLKNSIINRDAYALSRALGTAFTEFETTEISGISCRSLCFQLSKLVNTIMLNEQIIFDVDWMEQEEKLREMLDECATYRDMKKNLIQKLVDRFEVCIDREDGTDNRAVRVVKQYIANNYMKKIQLQDLAALVYLNPVYLSVCFKNEVGTNVVDYINEYRIERAKELLRDTQETVYMIAEAVGFSEARYFTKIFKRYVGMSPNEYRKNAT